ncbi:MAG: hypothetical protein ACI8TQ_002316 [Planctomycetota bacterium]|jgi:hypothetical protein
MRRQIILLLAITCFVGISATSFGQAETKADLESQVVALSSEVATLREDLQHSQTQIDQMLLYFKNNQKAAAELSKALTASETAGFTFGINPKSRELLLAGWRKQLDTAQKNVPGSASKPVNEGNAVVGSRFPR